MQRRQLSNPASLPRGRFPASRWCRAGLLVWLLAIGGLSGCSRDAPPTQLLIENVNVVDPVKGLLEKRQVLIEGGVITAVADASQTVASSANAERFDGQERFLIPGLWDMHVHFVYDMNLTDHMADLFLDYGITSVRDTGGNIDQLAELRRTMPAPKPNIYISGPLLDGKFVVYDGTDPARPALGTGVPSPGDADATVGALQAAEEGAHVDKGAVGDEEEPAHLARRRVWLREQLSDVFHVRHRQVWPPPPCIAGREVDEATIGSVA